MRLFELTTHNFYLLTGSKEKIGSVISLTGKIFRLDPGLEGALEQRRPDGCLPRETSIHISPEVEGDAAYIYKVVPTSRVDRHHTSWLKKLAAADPMNHGVVDQLATGYWSGEPIPEARSEPWEYRAFAIRIVERVGGYAPKSR